jgi:hypothetical protein
MILEEFRKNDHTYCRVKFKSTGSIKDIRKDALMRGDFKDRYELSVYGVGAIGMAKKLGNERAYNIWNNMISRCYNKNDRAFKQYGAKGTTVSKDWLIFEKFLNDIPLIDGYDKELFNQGKLALDKDKKQNGYVRKVYSLSTCTFLSQRENNQYKTWDNVNYIATHKDGREVLIKNLSKFAQDEELCRSHIYQCLKGIRKTHKGWRFNYGI